jgi:ribosomal protein S12 methylthiotransferase accessory factor
MTAAFGIDGVEQGTKGFLDGAHRLVSPSDTLARVEPMMPVLGITRVASVTGLDTIGIPVVMAYRPNARSLSVSSGKGPTLEAARASALMEALESFHGERVLAPLLLSTERELRHRIPLVDTSALPRVSVGRYDEHRSILWIEGHDLMAGEPRWVPFEMVHTNYTLPLPAGSGCFPMTSNGLSSGNHLLEAISHGLCEVIERDATTLFQGTRPELRARRRVDLATVDDPLCCAALQAFERARIAVGVWDITSDVEVAAFHVAIVDREPHPFRHMYTNVGVGCHPSRGVALLRALTEAAQGRLVYISGSRDDRDRAAYELARHPDRTRRAREELTEPGSRSFGEAPSFEGRTFEADVRFGLERLAAAGIRQAIFVDLAKPELGVPVVRVIVPGLEAIREVPGYMPGPRARARSAA